MRVAAGVFDNPLHDALCDEFLNDPRHHLAVAIDAGIVVGMASGVHYIHPDKAPELWINEVGVAPSHQNQGIGRQLVDALLNEGRRLGCLEAWVLADRTNKPALQMYAACGGVPVPDQVMLAFKL
ncbi:MAG: GNAT family N-acetyltransferase [Pirellulales bacterium]